VPVIIPGVIDSVFVNDQGDIIVTKQDGSQETVQRPPATSGNGGSGGESIPVVLTDSEGNRYTVNKDGTVTNNGTVSATTVDATVRYGVFFERDNTQAFGFDAKTNEALQRHYPTETVGTSPYIIPWKAVATGSFDQVKAIATEKRADFAKEIGLVSSFGPLAKRMGSRAGEAIVTVQGRTHEEVEEIRAYLTKKDAEGKEVEETVGRLNVVSYNLVYRTLVLVPVNGTSPGMEAASLQQQLNAIYSQAAVQWTVRIEEGFASTYDQDNNGLEYGNSGLLSNYTGEMRTILRDYTRTRASDTYYLFITPRADDNSVTGYMPRKKQAGFIFTDKISNNPAKIIAHELAHGAFRLEHSFPELPENGNNLMDYSLSGTTLHKHQWDLIHDPVAVLGLFEDDEDNAYAAQIIQCISAAAIDMAMNYTFKWVELNFLDNDPTNDYSIMDFGNIWRATDKWEMFSSASISCATSIIPWPSNKAKLIGVVTASFGAGATALVADVAQQYEKLPEALNFKDKLSAIHWDEAFKKAGVQSLIAGISTGVVLYAVDHPKFKNFASKVKNLSYARIELLLKKSGFSDEAVDAFCKRFGLSRLQGAGNWLTQRTSFWDDWINKCFPGKNWDNTTFQTLGKDYGAFKSANTALDNEMRAMYTTPSAADNFLPGIVNSGSTNPVKVTVNQGEKFYKIVPKGSNINGPSPYYLSEAEYQWIKANPSQLEQKLGLPLSSVSAEYDVFTITSKANNNTLFQSTVAPTKQFANATQNVVYNTTGGRTQSLIINNGDTDFWLKSSTPIETISPNSLPVIGN
jgi:hypothetical protein